MPQNDESMQQYFVRWRGRVEGPFSMDRLKALLQSGRITRHHQVSTDRQTWSPFSSLAIEETSNRVGNISSTEIPLVQKSGLPQLDIRQEEQSLKPHLRLQDEFQVERVVNGPEWFYLDNDQVVGPVAEQDIRSLLADGRLTAGSQVCRQGEDKWQPIRMVGEFAGDTTLSSPDGLGMPSSLPSGMWAGFWRRFVAILFDSLIVGAFSGIILIFLGVAMTVMGLARSDTYLVLRIFGPILAIVASWAYSTCMESSPRQATVGKIAMGIYVVDGLGRTISFGLANARYWTKALSGIILLAGFIMAAFTRKKQALHDMIAGTFVLSRE